MQHDITKLCADSLRATTLEKYGVKLKPTHAHELGAAFFGYPSKNTMLADTKYPISNLHLAKIVVMAPDDLIDQRRKDLEGLPPELPDSYALGEGVYAALFANVQWASAFPPFRSFLSLVKFMAEDRGLIESGNLYNIPRHHILDVKDTDDSVFLIVKHAYKADDGKMHVDAVTTVELPRVAGRIGFGLAKISEERRTGRAREVLVPLNA